MRFSKNKSKKKGGASIYAALSGGLKKVALHSIPYIFSLTLVGVLFGGVVAYAVNSPTFQLSEVKILNMGTVTQDQAFKFCELRRGENLVTLDLVNVQQVIKKRHPEFKEVLVRRILPNRIEVILKRRTPVAQIAFSRYVQIDRDRILLPGSSPTPFKNLTIIQGTPTPRQGPVVGLALSDAATIKAIKLADIVKRSNILRKHALSKVDVTDKRNFILIVDNAIEIRIGDSHFIERLKILDQTLKTVDLDPNKINYIDLRFDDVIIGSR